MHKLADASCPGTLTFARDSNRNGVGSEHDRRSLHALEEVLPELALDGDVWRAACELADRCRKAGRTAPVQDVLIAACARHHGVAVQYDDAHFDWLMKL